MRLKNRIKTSKKKKVFWLLTLALICSCILLVLITKKLNPSLQKYADLETKRLGTLFINHAVNEVNIGDINEIYITTKNDKGEILTVDFNSSEVNKLLKKINENVQKTLLNVENGNIKELNLSSSLQGVRYKKIKSGIVCEIPTGSLLGSVLFANLGPRIPIKMVFVGQVTTNIQTKVKEYGINNAYIEVSIYVEVIERIILPLSTKEQTVSVNVPIGMKVIQGTVPNFYNGAFDGRSNSFSLPITG